jgi:hypothetical protein
VGIDDDEVGRLHHDLAGHIAQYQQFAAVNHYAGRSMVPMPDHPSGPPCRS